MQLMGSVSEDSKIKIWDLRRGKANYSLYGHTGSVKSLRFSSAGDYLATGGEDKTILVWQTNIVESGTSEQEMISCKSKAPLEFTEEHDTSEKPKSVKQVTLEEDVRVENTLDKILVQLEKIHGTMKNMDSRIAQNEEEVMGLCEYVRNDVEKRETTTVLNVDLRHSEREFTLPESKAKEEPVMVHFE
jgi:WD40 repeat protein